MTAVGRGFAFEDLSHAALGNAPGAIAHDAVRNAKGLRPGGFGLVLIRAIADELIYNERRNEVLFVKYLDDAPADALVDSQARGSTDTPRPAVY